ncbi:uncharacterized protein TNIN_215541 [Trichonephila inaurata madagascariensis]|uniref:Uncharacterized protein n=1 Tax=Trichonephila inaurata madagascariensis TaxID=2747483 RepID=A0A8X7CQK2_9ARAC|nr:uncharacterized protein TNIN_215541 [Trichonephila inaurata madagascariensis]
MNPEEKKRLANEKRLKALKGWKNRNQQPIKVEAKSVRKTYDDPEVKSNDKNKLTLFDSDGEDNYEADFNIRPQFEGEKGQKLFERNSYLSNRFKLDERFKDDEEEEEIPEIPVTEEQEEKKKNIKILESILGYEVIEKYNTEGQKSMKRQKMVRFDPEDKNASEFLETPVEKPPKESRKKRKVEEKTEEKEIPISTERFVEVKANLKELLQSSAPTFSLSEKFSNKIEVVNDFSFSFNKKDLESNKEIQKDYINTPVASQCKKNIFDDGKKFLFFISENDGMLKEGVEFFQRKETLDELYEKWTKRKEGVQEVFKQKRKIFERGSAPKNRMKRYGKK